jgi:hypothetical protein
LLSAVIADGMTGKRHDPDAELVGQGLANVVGPFFGGIAATGALARTATNIRSGARSPLASVTHALVVLGSGLVLAPVVAICRWRGARLRSGTGEAVVALRSIASGSAGTSTGRRTPV